MNSMNIVITGTSTGFGLLTTLSLLDKGHHVWASMRNLSGTNKENAESLARDAKGKPGSLEIIELDVTDDISVKNAVSRIEKSGRPVDVLVNNAGAGSMSLLEDFTVDMLKDLFDLNVFGVFRMTKAVLPLMKKRKDGLVINISSGLGRVCLPTYTYYNATKWALEALSQSWKYEFAPLGIDMVIVEPGAYPTTKFIENMGPYSKDGSAKAGEYGDLFKMHANFRAMVEQKIKDGTINDPRKVADAVVRIVETPKGMRPTRTVVDEMFEKALGPYNKMLDDIQGGILNGMGIGSLVSPAK